jgi:hypothetical protein
VVTGNHSYLIIIKTILRGVVEDVEKGFVDLGGLGCGDNRS